MLTWTRYSMKEDWFREAVVNGLFWLAIFSVIFAILFVFVINPIKANETWFNQLGEDYTYDDFYDENYYNAHHEEMLFGVYQAVIVSWSANWTKRVVHVEIDGSILDGTDANCRIFGFVMKHITANDVLVVVTNTGYIPSTRNPIDHAWATHLAYPDGVPYMPAE